MRTGRWRAFTTLFLIALMLTSCSSGMKNEEPPAASFEAVDCPDSVRGVVVGTVSCGHLVVPEKRSEPTGRTVRVFVTRVSPAGEPAGQPMLVAGTNLASLPNYSGIAPLAQRTGREVIIVDGRGIGHSEPSLDCPEVKQVGATELSVPTDDPTLGANRVAATKACWDRLRSEGIDLASYDLTAMADDLADLQVALGVETWTVITYGTASRIVAELVRQHPDAVSAVILDSPELPGMDPAQIAIEDTGSIVNAVLAECTADRRCAAAYPNASSLLSRALAATADHPLLITGSRPGGGQGEVLLDDQLLLRTLRQMLSDGGSSGTVFTIGSVPQVLTAVIERDTAALKPLVSALLRQQPFCVGYRSACLGRHEVSIGVELTVTCRNVQPFAARLDPADDLGHEIEQILAHSAAGLCASWPVSAADSAVNAAVDSELPALVLTGSFGLYAPPDRLQPALRGLASASLVIDPAWGHNVVPASKCTLSLRDAWLSHPKPVSSPPGCLQQRSITWRLS